MASRPNVRMSTTSRPVENRWTLEASGRSLAEREVTTMSEQNKTLYERLQMVLVPSPFTGAITWNATAEILPDAVIVDYGSVSAPDWYEQVAERVVAQIDGRKWIAVLHSGAGGFAPALKCASTSLAGFIFVDAVLPYPGKSCLETVPEYRVSKLKRLTKDGLLAPWNEWFGPSLLPQLVPDQQAREAFTRRLPRVPFAFLEAVSPTKFEWEQIPTAYLQLSAVYAETATRAESRGWIVRRVQLHHLAMITDPARIGELLCALLSELQIAP